MYSFDVNNTKIFSKFYIFVQPSPQSNYRTLASSQKLPCAHLQSVTSHPTPNARQTPIQFCRFAFLDILYKWKHTICGLLCLASFIRHNVFEALFIL